MRQLLLVVGIVGCGTSGEPLEGDVSVDYGGDRPDLAVGSAVVHRDDTANMLVQLGSDDVDCETYLDELFLFSGPEGTFVYFSVPQTTGTHAQAYVAVMKSEDNSSHTNIASGMVTIDAVEPRVTGSVTFSTTGDDVGAISVSGSFDVKRCF